MESKTAVLPVIKTPAAVSQAQPTSYCVHLPFVKVTLQSLFLVTKLGPQPVVIASVQVLVYTLHQLVARSISELVWAETEAARARVAIMSEAFMMDCKGIGV